VITYGTGFIIALVVDEKFLDVESYSVMLTGPKVHHQVTFYEIQLLALFTQQEDVLANLKLPIGGRNDFLEFLV